MVYQVRRLATISLGVLSLVVGVIGGFIPIFQGWIFVLLGLTLLAREVPFVRHRLDAVKQRYPRQAEQLDRLKAKWLPNRVAKPLAKD